MGRRSLDVLLAGGLAALALGLALAGAAGPLRALAGTLLALALPGYALAAALFPQQGMGRLERGALAGGLSIAATIGLGFALHLLPWGLTPVSWAAALALLTWLAGAAALVRRGQTGAAAEPIFQPPSLGMAAGQGLLVLAAAGVLIGALALGRSEAQVQPADAVLQLWMLPADPAAPRQARIGLISSGGAAGTFRLRVQRDGRLLREWPALAIAPGQQWEATIDVGAAGAGPVEGLLYPAGAQQAPVGEPLREVIYWPGAAAPPQESVGTP